MVKTIGQRIWNNIFQHNIDVLMWVIRIDSVRGLRNGTEFFSRRINCWIRVEENENKTFDITFLENDGGRVIKEDVTSEKLVSEVNDSILQIEIQQKRFKAAV